MQPKPKLEIPTPRIEEVEDYEKNVPSTYEAPTSYVRYLRATPDELKETLEYLADAEDEVWLHNHAKFGNASSKPLPLIMFETMMDSMEKATAFETIVTIDEAERCILHKLPSLMHIYPKGRGGPGIVTLRNVLQDTYSYWVHKRSKLKRPLLRRFWPVTASDDTNPHLVFRPREKEKYKLRKKRMNDMDAFRKMKQLRMDFEKVRALLDLVRKREALHRMVILAGEECFEQQLYNLVDTSGLPRVSKVLKRDSMDELLGSPLQFDAITGAMNAADKRRRVEEYAKRTTTPVSATSDPAIASAPPVLVAGQNYGEPAPLFLHPLKTRESYVSSWHNAVPFISSYEDSHPTPTFVFRHRPRVGRGGRLCIDRLPHPIHPDLAVESVFRAGQRLPMPPKQRLLDLMAQPLDYATISRNIEELCAAPEVLGDEENDGEEVVVKLEDWLATDDQLWGDERFAIGPV